MFACAAPAAAAQDSVEITHAHIDATDDGYRLSAAYAFDLNRGLEEAIQHGVALYFTTEIEIVHPRWYWRDEVMVSKRITARISYDVLTREYAIKYTDSVRQTFNTLDEAIFAIRRPPRWMIAPKGAFKPGENYVVTLKMGMDREYFSKPIQVNSFNNAEWRLNSNTKKFIYKAE
ncbi:DUF4390 domain-containing protein [Massilia arenosa]|uniref:DUF4390 domain-containing protein n=1 Tax=Zemynaea arenosa TaxID=2561931 RepID=A0A4Y9S4E6_9BURK|nr:DUF4390 domain-containing protein [Massilia arenosa]TFW16219.1 DUF4390 domain-containing protein [Massilia arenosa]